MTALAVTVAVAILVALTSIAVIANRFARQRQLVLESWRQVEVELQRRYDLRRALDAAGQDAGAGDRADLHRQLAETEDRVAAARRFYNANVRALRTRTSSFPGNVVAGMVGVAVPDYFAAEPRALRTAPDDGDAAH